METSAGNSSVSSFPVVPLLSLSPVAMKQQLHHVIPSPPQRCHFQPVRKLWWVGRRRICSFSFSRPPRRWRNWWHRRWCCLRPVTPTVSVHPHPPLRGDSLYLLEASSCFLPLMLCLGPHHVPSHCDYYDTVDNDRERSYFHLGLSYQDFLLYYLSFVGHCLYPFQIDHLWFDNLAR